MASILIVEDNRNLAYGLQNNLEIEGHVGGGGRAMASGGMEAARRKAGRTS